MNTTITKLDEVWMRIDSDEDTLNDIYEHFSFFVPNYQFMPAFKYTEWDGKIHLFDRGTNKMEIGLLRRLIAFIGDADIDPKLQPEEEMSQEEAEAYVATLNLPDYIQVDDYQYDAFLTCINKRRSFIISPTGSGKSLEIYLTAHYLNQKYGYKTLIIVPTTSLTTQMVEEFVEYNNGEPVDAHSISAGVDKNVDATYTVSTWQSIGKIPAAARKKWMNKFDVIIGDEGHTFNGKTLTGIMQQTDKVEYKFGFTGTLHDSKVDELQLNAMFGSIKQVVTTEELQKRGRLTKIEIKALKFQYPVELCQLMSKNKDYDKEIDFIEASAARLKKVGNLALSTNKNTLVLFRHIEHGNKIYEYIRTRTNRRIFLINGSTKKKIRDEFRAIVEKEEDAIIVASYGVLSTGVNIKNLHYIIFASPYKSKIKVLQSIGRGLRLHASKSVLVLFDLVDDLSYRNKKNFGVKHYVERYKLYLAEMFEVEHHTINL